VNREAVTAEPASGKARAATAGHIRGSSLLLAGRGIALAINFAVQVLTVRYLAKADYGAFAYAMVLMTFGSSLAAMGMDKAASRFVPIYHERRDYARMFGAMVLCVGTMLALGLALVLAVFGASGLLSEGVISDPLAVSVLLILVTMAPLEALDRLLEKLVAAFARPRAIFFRRHVLGPGLKLAAVLLLVAFDANVYFLAAAYVVAGAIGTGLYGHILWRTLREQGLLAQFSRRDMVLPAGELLGYGAPIFATDALWLLRGSVAVFLLEYFHSTAGVAEFRAVLPVAGLNKVVFESFQLLFMPAAARLVARGDRAGMNDLYWQTSAWIAVLSFPAFVASFALAQPLTVLLFGEQYAASALVLAILSLGNFVNAALGFNALTLRALGKVRWIVAIDVASFVALVAANVALVPRYGAVGGAVATCGGIVLNNLLNQAALMRIQGMEWFPRRYLALCAVMLAAAAGVTALQWAWSPPLLVGAAAAALASAAVLWLNRVLIDVEAVFPELLRFPLLKRLVAHPGKAT
jgi:O-antigen/teichoic acid export membrane protein